ncbi:MAG: class I SAM-dependent methyltransferase, partial [Planctomycetes bacterium]|nr:class I SAM-dependent methyltransferase [Planctomycetota bacterium]
ELLAGQVRSEGPLSVLNLFAHTGLVTLMAARAEGVSVTHVDAAPASVRQARENAVLSGLEDRPIRWIVDDAAAFLRREVRRGRRYGVIVADPPAYGRSRKGGEWKFSRDLPMLLETAAELLADPPGRLFLTCHEEGFGRDDATTLVRSVLGGNARAEQLRLAPADGGQALPAGVVVTWNR